MLYFIKQGLKYKLHLSVAFCFFSACMVPMNATREDVETHSDRKKQLQSTENYFLGTRCSAWQDSPQKNMAGDSENNSKVRRSYQIIASYHLINCNDILGKQFHPQRLHTTIHKVQRIYCSKASTRTHREP